MNRKVKKPITIVLVLVTIMAFVSSCVSFKKSQQMEQDLGKANSDIVALQNYLETVDSQKRGISQQLTVTRHKVGVLTETNENLEKDFNDMKADMEYLKDGMKTIQATSTQILNAVEK
jgi:peptidoglycan hydrolase CwlO-like protein